MKFFILIYLKRKLGSAVKSNVSRGVLLLVNMYCVVYKHQKFYIIAVYFCEMDFVKIIFYLNKRLEIVEGIVNFCCLVPNNICRNIVGRSGRRP